MNKKMILNWMIKPNMRLELEEREPLCLFHIDWKTNLNSEAERSRRSLFEKKTFEVEIVFKFDSQQSCPSTTFQSQNKLTLT